MFRVDLNADLGESFGAYKIGCDREVLEQVTWAIRAGAEKDS